MKNKLSKIAKPVLSTVVAVAIIAVSLFTVIPGINIGADAATVTDTWDGTLATAFESGDGSKDNPYVIKTAEQLAYMALSKTLNSADKYFKVVDNAVFDLAGLEGITLDSGVGDVKAATKGKKWHNDDAQVFSGNFDGNGLVVYNLYSAGGYAGLFPVVVTNNTAKSVTIKNVTVVNSYICGYHFSGGIVGFANANTTDKSITFENCAVKNCFISDNNNANTACERTSGILAGGIGHNKATVKNCIAIDNITSATNITGGFIGNTSAYAGVASITNSIAIGTLPYSVQNSGSSKELQDKSTQASCYANVYTDQNVSNAYADSNVKKVSKDNMKGSAARANMTGLDWSVWIAFDGEYPDLRSNHTLSVTSGDVSGHKIVCSDCQKSMTEAHVLKEDSTGTYETCECGYKKAIAISDKKIVKWKDTSGYENTVFSSFAAFTESMSGDGTENNPYIIKTAEQLYFLLTATNSANSKGKYFKVADNIYAFDFTAFSGVTENTSSTELKAFNDNWTWNKFYSENAQNSNFSGTFDGNGVIIYNYGHKGNKAGLFNVIGADAVIKNLTIKACMFKVSASPYAESAGGIIGQVSGGWGSSVTIENCAVINCVIISEGRTGQTNGWYGAGALVGAAPGFKVNVNNCLVRDTVVETLSTGAGSSLIGFSSFAPTISNTVSLGVTPYATLNGNISAIGSDGWKIDTMAAASNFSNVYTDQAVADSKYAPAQIKYLTASEMSGKNALDNMVLDFTNVWYANNKTPELQISHKLVGAPDTENAANGHVANCTDCGLTGVNVIPHDYLDGTCRVCSYTCTHNNNASLVWNVTTKGDCLTADKGYYTCADCGYKGSVISDPNFTAGHVLEKVSDGKAADCGNAGEKAYWRCTVCQGIFLSDDATSSDVKTLDDVIISATGNHVEKKDSNNKLLYGMNSTEHWTICKTCNHKVATATHTGTFTPQGAKGHVGVCDVCGYETVDGIVPHEFGDDNVCDVCNWVCSDHVAADGNVIQEGSCTEDRIVEQYCSVCGQTLQNKVVTALGHQTKNVDYKAPTCTETGFEAHQECTVCGKLFVNGSEVSLADVTIAALGHDYELTAGGTPKYYYNDKGHWYKCSKCGDVDFCEHIIETDTTSYNGTYRFCEDSEGYGCDWHSFEYNIDVKEQDMNIHASEGAFTKDVIFDYFEITEEDAAFEKVTEQLEKVGITNFVAYDVSPSEAMAQGGTITVTLKLSAIFGEDTDLYYLDTATGKVQRLNGTITQNSDGKTYTLVGISDKVGVIVAATIPLEEETSTDDGSVGGNSGSTGNNVANTDNGTVSPKTSDSLYNTVGSLALLTGAAYVIIRKAKRIG